jgi:uncharacterized membrane protein
MSPILKGRWTLILEWVLEQILNALDDPTIPAMVFEMHNMVVYRRAGPFCTYTGIAYTIFFLFAWDFDKGHSLLFSLPESLVWRSH